jgi:hypothetical protein
LVTFSGFGIVQQEKSGNPASNLDLIEEEWGVDSGVDEPYNFPKNDFIEAVILKPWSMDPL